MSRYLVIDLQAANGQAYQAYLAGLPVMRNPGLARQARMAEEEDSYQFAPYPQFADARDDSAGSASGAPAYGAPGPAAPHAGPDHVDYGAYTGGYGAFGWYTDHPVLLGPGHRRKRQAQLADDFQVPRSRFQYSS